MTKTLRFFLPLLILAIGAWGFWQMYKTKPKSQPITTSEPAWVVSVVPVTPATLSPTVTLYGRLESTRTATLRAPTQSSNLNTEVVKVAVLEGKKVKKGDILIRLEDEDSTLNMKLSLADIAEVEAQIALERQRHANNLTAIAHEKTLLRLTQKSFERYKRLKKQRVSSQSSLDEAQQAVERQTLTIVQRRLDIKNHQPRLKQLQAKRTRALAQHEMARLELARTKITAPFTGIITEIFVAIGERVRSGDNLLSMYDNAILEVRAQIPTSYQDIILDSLAIGRKLQAYALVNKKQVLMQLERVSGKINPDSGGIDGLFRVKKGGSLLRLGQFLSLYLNLPKQAGVVALPYEAIYGTNRIYKLVNKRMKRLTVERVGEQILSSGKSQLLVRSPALQKGSQVIITQLPMAQNGLKVRLDSEIVSH